jgi:hypothetical protein
MPDYTEKAEKLKAFVLAYGDTTYSVNAIKMALMKAYEDGLDSSQGPVQPVAAPPVIVQAPAADGTILDSEVTQ